ncbi:MAG TPA: hypothetical protein ENK66_05075 [Arcobacter sp.]|nr:hypothetical protein [Arcobacter sp.]
MKVALLGGSNSVKRFGLSSGLKENPDIQLYNFALGGCSCLQNLDAIIANYESISQMDVIISESNINDFYNVNTQVVPFELMQKNIAKYYLLLSQLNVRVISILLPINMHLITENAYQLFSEVIYEHLFHIKNHGFEYVNIENYVSTYLSENKSINFKNPHHLLVPDGFHTKSLFMHQVGLNLYAYLLENICSTDIVHNTKVQVDYVKLKAEHFNDVSIADKENTFFKERTMLVNKKIFFPKQYIGYKIIGVSTWGEGGLNITNTSKSIIKNFNDLYSFNEILEDFLIDNKTYMIHSGELITEKSMNTSSTKSNKNPSVVGFLLECSKNDGILISTDQSFSKIKYFQRKCYEFSKRLRKNDEENNLNFLLPSLEIYLYDSNEFTARISEEDIDALRDAAILLENIDLKKAYRLMSIAYYNRPSGLHIRNKVLEYKAKLNI